LKADPTISEPSLLAMAEVVVVQIVDEMIAESRPTGRRHLLWRDAAALPDLAVL